MNGNFYQNPTFPNNPTNQMNQQSFITSQNAQDDIPLEQSYIENILRLNKGKNVKVFVSYPESSAWQNKDYVGIIEEAGRDHLILKDSQTGTWYLLRLLYIDYVEFMEPINYAHGFSEKTF